MDSILCVSNLLECVREIIMCIYSWNHNLVTTIKAKCLVTLKVIIIIITVSSFSQRSELKHPLINNSYSFWGVFLWLSVRCYLILKGGKWLLLYSYCHQNPRIFLLRKLHYFYCVTSLPGIKCCCFGMTCPLISHDMHDT